VPFGDHGGLIQKSGAEIPDLPATYSDELKKIVELCLQQDPWDRPAANTILTWTQQHDRGERIFDPEPPSPSPSPTSSQKKRTWRIVGVLFGLLFSLSIILIISINSTETKTVEEATESTTEAEVPTEQELENFKAYRQAAISNYENGKRESEKGFHEIALGYCNSALAIQDDDTLKEIKSNIESKLNQ
jgi:hypothetical protein